MYRSVMGVELLSERERECLRLLLRPMRAKEIARALDLSIHTVNDHLKSARGKLGAGDSLTAALMLREAEAGSPQNLGPTESGWPDRARFGHVNDTEVINGGSAILPFAVKGRPWNGLSLRWRIVWPLVLLGVIALAAGVLLGGIAALSQLAVSLTR